MKHRTWNSFSKQWKSYKEQICRRFNTAVLLAAVILCLGNAVIVYPYLATAFSDQPWNNGQIYLAIARIFRDHPWSWNSLQYCGAPLRYLYPPVMQMLVTSMPGLSLAHSFRLATGCAYIVTPFCLFLLARELFKSQTIAWFAAIAYSVFPSLVYLSATWRNLTASYGWAPWEFVTFVGYEEAAHVFAFPLAILALVEFHRRKFTRAAGLMALVALSSWPALVGLSFPLIGIAIIELREGGFKHAVVTIGAAVGIAYGLTAFWISPDYFVSTTLLNRIVLSRVPIAPSPWGWITWSILITAMGAVILVVLLKASARCLFLTGWVASAGAVILAYTWEGSHLVPAPNRYMLELNAGITLALAAVVWIIPWRRAPLLVILTVLGFYSARFFMADPWKFFPASQEPSAGIAYQIAQALNSLHGQGRVFAAGEVEETLPLWSDRRQVGGTNQDITNFLAYSAQRYIAFSCGTKRDPIGMMWLDALNVRYLVVHGGKSREHYHWFTQPDRWKGLPLVWESAESDWIFDINSSTEPREDPGEAVVVDLNELARIPQIRSIDDETFLATYLSWAHGKRPVEVRWTNQGTAAEIEARIEPGEAVLVKTNFARGWQAQGSQIGPDPIGFLMLRDSPGTHHWKLKFTAAWPLLLGRAISVATLLLLMSRLPRIWIAVIAVAPAFTAYIFLMMHLPRTVKVAERAFAQIEPPQIFPGGVVNGSDDNVSVWGVNFGRPRDRVSAWLNGKQVETTFHSANLVTFRLPRGVPQNVVVSIDVNGCRGNEFPLAPSR